MVGVAETHRPSSERGTSTSIGTPPRDEPRPRSAEETRLLDAISQTSPREVKDIAARAGLSLAAVQSLLGALELEEFVTERERGWVKTKPKDPNKPPPPLA
jgi:predicted Rossmann fold nucleotide-binding protein DprA/Smf involved in DNA uptake